MEGVWLVMIWCLLMISSTAYGGSHSYGDPKGNVTYDERSLIINGQHRILFSGSIHYPRSTPQTWRSLVAKAKKGGLDVIQTYVFWNLHEPQPGKFDFSGRRDIVKFIKEIQAQGLYVCLRIGPFIESEWSYGALPFWLHDVPGIVFRSDNKLFKFYMKKFATKIVNMMKSERLYASQGGPIILSQIENEYKMVEAAFGEKGPAYVRWAARMAVNLQTGVPWVMCKQDDAPDPVINACNGRRCGETFAGPNSPNKPSIWTENWTSFYQTYGEEEVMRSVEDIAFHVALFIARKGSYVNYYMYHGGTNFGRTASAYVTPRYYDQAPLDEYGFVRQPMWGHLKELHAAIKLCINPLIAGKYRNISLGELQQAYVFRKSSELCAAFLANNDTSSTVTVLFGDLWYKLPPKSISILPDCRTVVFNTAKVNTEYGTRGVTHSQQLHLVDSWEEYKEAILEFDKTLLRTNELLEQMSTTNDISDYLWYTFRFEQNAIDPEYELSVKSFGHVLHAFVNGEFAGSAHGNHKNKSFTLRTHVSLHTGANHVSILSGMVGLPDSGAFLERRFAGLRRVHVKSRHQFLDFTHYTWGYQVGLMGEKLEVYSKHGSDKVQWKEFRTFADRRLTWYKTYFDEPPGKDPVTLNLNSMGKGEAWVNGESIGRYWVSFHTPSGSPSQERYSIPRSFLKSKDNLLVLFEEEHGNPLHISIDTISIKRVCGYVSDSHPPLMASWIGLNHTGITHDKAHGRRPKVQLSCPPRKKISNIVFASFGTPSGDCENYGIGVCHSYNSRHIVTKACLGKKMCSVPVTSQNFGQDPCPDTSKSLLIVAECH